MFWFLILVLMIPLVAVVLDSRLGRALASRIEGGSPDNARLSALETEVDRLTTELERLQEQTEFVTLLLEERTGSREDPGGAAAQSALPPDEAGG